MTFLPVGTQLEVENRLFSIKYWVFFSHQDWMGMRVDKNRGKKWSKVTLFLTLDSFFLPVIHLMIIRVLG